MRDEHDLELATVEFVPDDDLMPVPLKRGAGFGDEEIWVCFELVGHGSCDVSLRI